MATGDSFNPEHSTQQSEAPKSYQKYSQIEKALEEQKKLNELLKEQERVEERIKSISEEIRKANREASEEEEKYLKNLGQRRIQLRDDIQEQEKEVSRRNKILQDHYKTSIEDEKELRRSQRERNEEEEYYAKELEEIDKRRKKLKEDLAKTTDKDKQREIKSELQDLDNQEISTRIARNKFSGKNGTSEDVLGKNNTLSSILALLSGFHSDKEDSKVGGAANDISRLADKFDASIATSEKIAATVNLISKGLVELRQTMSKSINQAAQAMSSYFGRIQANLEGTGMDYYSISDDTEAALGFSRLIKQTDYLSQIADLSNQGLVTDIEQRALLESIKDRTLTSFNVANAGLQRLVRLGEQNSINQFGLELQLKRVLNKFGDSSYLQSMFDGVTSAIMDASVVGSSEITNFNSTVQTWLGSMYSYGMSENIVNAIATGINALGSGNVKALTGDESIQRLFLLSMDRIGMDYADVLQQGLSSDDVTQLLASVIKYLDEISSNTKDNLVLKSSYSNLFNMSVTDMEAIHNVASSIGDINKAIISVGDSQKLVKDAVTNVVSQNTLASEKFENMFANFSYSFGSNVAESGGLYTTYRISEMVSDLFGEFAGLPGKIGKAAKAGQAIFTIPQYIIGIKSLTDMLTSADSVNSLQSFSNDSLISLLGSMNSSGAFATRGTYAPQGKNSSLKQFTTTNTEIISTALNTSDQDWGGEDEDEIVGYLKELTKALLKNKDGNYAFAVSLQGMSDEVLKSFASIFADEDAMLSTFKGTNNVLKDALFGYFDDTTSNSNNGNNKAT